MSVKARLLSETEEAVDAEYNGAARDVADPDHRETAGGRRLRPRDGALVLGAYLYGSIPLIYLMARQRRVDLRRSGSGNVGATNLWASVGAARAVGGWVFDASKGFVPIVVGRRLGCRDDVAKLAGICGVAGQCWPVFLRFRGGRGISAFVGAAALINPRAWLVSLAPMIVGGLWRITPVILKYDGRAASALRESRGKAVPLGCLVGVLTFPLAAASISNPARAPRLPALLSSLLLLRRLTAPLPDDIIWGPGMEREALLYRLLYDRNTSG